MTFCINSVLPFIYIDILKKLIEKQNQIIQSRREEKLLGSDPDADDDEED